MVLDPAKRAEAEAVFRKWHLDFAEVGVTTDDLRFRVLHMSASGQDITQGVVIILAILLPKQPPELGQRTEEEAQLDRRMRAEPHNSLHSIRHRFRDLDRRLQNIERYVTSKRFKLDREFDGLDR